jgi:choline-sulfatase
MSRRSFYTIPLILLLSASCGSDTPASESSGAGSEGPSRNVLLITIDTLRWDYLGCYGKSDIETPNLDGLASRGVRFERALVQSPLTTPSHACMLTGQYPSIHQIRDVGGFVLDESIPTLAGLLSQRGYQTAALVAASVLHRRFGLDRGFDVYNDHMTSDPDVERLPGVVAEVRGDTITARALEWLEGRDRRRNFFLWVHYYDPHFPYDPPAAYRSRYSEDPYAGEVAFVDEQIGVLLQRLESEGLDESTLVMAISDHGESLGDHGEYTHGVFLYDSTIRVPLLIAGPGIRRGVVEETLARSIDLMPTALEFAGVSVPSELAGESLLPVLREGLPVRIHYSFMETFYPQTQMRWSELFGAQTVRWKYILAPTPELYDLQSERGENENLIDRHPDEAERLQREILRIIGTPGSEREIAYRPLDEATLRELQTLGYVSAGGSRKIVMDLSGPDPKEKVAILQGLDRATTLMNRGDFAAAVPVLQGLVRQDPGNPLVYQNLGICLQEVGDFRTALGVYESAVRNGADTDRTHAEIGEIRIRLYGPAAGIDALRKSAELNPRNLDNLGNLANAYLETGQIEEAESAVQAILAQNPDHATAHNLEGMIHIMRREPLRARRSFERAVQLNPDLVEPYMNLGILAQMAGDNPAAIRYFRAFLERAKDPQYAEVVPRVERALADLQPGARSPSD